MRILAMLANEAADAVYRCVCSEGDADIATLKGLNYPAGPLAWGKKLGWHRIYDVLRGLSALVRCAELTHGPLPLRAVETVIEHLVAEFPDGVVRTQRRAYAVTRGTIVLRDGAWMREPPASFQLLEVTSAIGEPSEALTRQWSATRRALLGLIDDGRIAA